MTTLTFEGYVNLESGWEFDAPLFVLSPVRRAEIPVSNAGGVDLFVEDYMIDLAVGNKPHTDESDQRYDWNTIERFFNNAKNGLPHRGIIYWRRVIEYTEEGLQSDDVFSEIERVGWGV